MARVTPEAPLGIGAGAGAEEGIGSPDSLQEARLLTEVDHLLACRRADGGYDEADDQAIQTNLETAVAEMSFPGAVTSTVQWAEYIPDEDGRTHRLFRWLGDCAVQVAESGYLYHESPAAQARVEIEIDESWHSEAHCTPGVAQPFLSPKMTAKDAPREVAEAEHLYDDDSIRVATAVTGPDGRVVARKLESLLVRDIPLSAWVAMLRDPNNIFGRAFDIDDDQSALPVMALFDQMALPEDRLPEGPVSLVAAVLPYIKDNAAYDSVSQQLERFRGDQEIYRRVSREKAAEWLQFEKELAESLHTGWATTEVVRFIATLQHRWGDEDLQCINGHQAGSGFLMSRPLAARLEKAKQNILASIAAIKTGNQEVLDQMDEETGQAIQDEIAIIERARDDGIHEAEIRRMEARLQDRIAAQNLTVGGGCPGRNEANFRNGNPDKPQGVSADGEAEDTDSEDRSKWKWKRGRCIIDVCPTRPGVTLVGPCDICERCQHVFDAGGDPTTGNAPAAAPAAAETPASPVDSLIDDLTREFREFREARERARRERAGRKAGEYALAS